MSLPVMLLTEISNSEDFLLLIGHSVSIHLGASELCSAPRFSLQPLGSKIYSWHALFWD
jgi:hypothetical protein